MARLPVVGSDNGTWGTILNEYLSVGHNGDGTHKTILVGEGGTGATNAAAARSNLGAISSSDAQGLINTHKSTDVHDAAQKLTVKSGGSAIGTRPAINFSAGSNVTLNIVDDSGNNEVDVTISSSGGAGGYALIQDEGSDLTQRSTINFVGDSVAATDDAGAGRSNVTINHKADAVHTAAQPVTVKKAGVATGTRPGINLIEGANISITTADDAGNSEVDVTIATTGLATSAALSAHEADTTNIHGIADTSVLETTSGAQAKVDTHVNDTSAAHAASAVSFSPTGTVAATDVQAAIAEVASEAATNLTNHEAAADPHTGYLKEDVLTTKGDIYAASAASTPVRVPVGTNGQVLTADSAASAGVTWTTPAAGTDIALTIALGGE